MRGELTGGGDVEMIWCVMVSGRSHESLRSPCISYQAKPGLVSADKATLACLPCKNYSPVLQRATRRARDPVDMG
jgi:hypothetical protein